MGIASTRLSFLRSGIVRGLLLDEITAWQACSSYIISTNWLQADGRIARIEADSGDQGRADALHDNGKFTPNSKLINLDATAISRGLTSDSTVSDFVGIGGTEYDTQIDIFYDQTGNGRHFLGAGTGGSAFKPRVYSTISNEFELKNGVIAPYLSFARWFVPNNLNLPDNTDMVNMFIVAESKNAFSTRGDIVDYRFDGTFIHMGVRFNQNANNTMSIASRRISSNSLLTIHGNVAHNNELTQIAAEFDFFDGNLRLSQNNVLATQSTSLPQGNTSGSNYSQEIGSSRTAIAGNVGEMVMIRDSTNKTNIELINLNQMQRWGID